MWSSKIKIKPMQLCKQIQQRFTDEPCASELPKKREPLEKVEEVEAEDAVEEEDAVDMEEDMMTEGGIEMVEIEITGETVVTVVAEMTVATAEVKECMEVAKEDMVGTAGHQEECMVEAPKTTTNKAMAGLSKDLEDRSKVTGVSKASELHLNKTTTNRIMANLNSNTANPNNNSTANLNNSNMGNHLSSNSDNLEPSLTKHSNNNNSRNNNTANSAANRHHNNNLDNLPHNQQCLARTNSNNNLHSNMLSPNNNMDNPLKPNPNNTDNRNNMRSRSSINNLVSLVVHLLFYLLNNLF